MMLMLLIIIDYRSLLTTGIYIINLYNPPNTDDVNVVDHY